MRALVYGLAVAGASTVRALGRRGHDVVVVDDAMDDAKRDLANALGVELLPTPLAPLPALPPPPPALPSRAAYACTSGSVLFACIRARKR